MAGELNVYRFAGSNPVGFVDPLGLCFWPTFERTFLWDLNVYWSHIKDINKLRTVLALLLGVGAAVAKDLGSASIADIWRTIIKPLLMFSAPVGIVTLGGTIGTIASFLLTVAITTGASGVALAIGFLVGALIDAYIWAQLDDSPCPGDCDDPRKK